MNFQNFQRGFSNILLISILLVLFAAGSFYTFTQVNKPWKNTEGTACNFGGCYTSEKNQKYNYWLAQAIEKRNPELCNNVDGIDNGDYQTPKQEAVYFCKAAYGGKIGDVDYCHKLDSSVKYTGTSTQQYVCFQEIAKNAVDLQTCDKLPNDSYPVNVRYECYAKVAERNSDAIICQKISEQGYDRNYRGSRKNCLIAVGEKLNSTKVCQHLSEKWIIDECVEAIEQK